jgi:ABC-type Mn2+/Zn2+ transport system ATPase subunit
MTANLLVVSHHDLRTVRELFDQVIFINGKLVAFGGTTVFADCVGHAV